MRRLDRKVLDTKSALDISLSPLSAGSSVSAQERRIVRCPSPFNLRDILLITRRSLAGLPKTTFPPLNICKPLRLIWSATTSCVLYKVTSTSFPSTTMTSGCKVVEIISHVRRLVYHHPHSRLLSASTSYAATPLYSFCLLLPIYTSMEPLMSSGALHVRLGSPHAVLTAHTGSWQPRF